MSDMTPRKAFMKGVTTAVCLLTMAMGAVSVGALMAYAFLFGRWLVTP